MDLYTYEVAKLMHQHTMQKFLYCFTSLFTNISDIHAKNTRSNSKNNFYHPKYSTSRCQKSIRFQGPKIWNSLSPEIRNQPYSKFKNNLKKHLLEKYISVVMKTFTLHFMPFLILMKCCFSNYQSRVAA